MKIKRRYHDGGNYILRSTDELLEEFSFLGKDMAYEAVIKNPNKLAELIKY